MSPMQILNQLLAGKKINLKFQDKSEAEAFRQRMYKIKKKQDAVMSAILDEEKVTLKVKISSVYTTDAILLHYKMELWTVEKKAPSYTILSIEEGEKDSNAAGEFTDDDDSST